MFGTCISVHTWEWSAEVPTETLSATVTPGQPYTFTHNEYDDGSPDYELIRSQVNAYVAANEVHDWVLLQNPAYPGISTDVGYPVYVSVQLFVCNGDNVYGVNPYAEATVDASPDGQAWTQLWSSGWLAINDHEWTTETCDLSQVVGSATEVHVRWGYQVYPGARAYSGWNIDDVEFLGDAAP